MGDCSNEAGLSSTERIGTSQKCMYQFDTKNVIILMCNEVENELYGQ
jgi:hypothetical protein